MIVGHNRKKINAVKVLLELRYWLSVATNEGKQATNAYNKIIDASEYLEYELQELIKKWSK
jgi:hypothetical protein